MSRTLDPELCKTLVQHALESSDAPRRWHVTRLFMYRSLENTLARLDGPDKTILSISHSQRLARICGLGKAAVVEASYPDHNIIDLHAFEAECADFLVADQVLEHVAGDPYQAISESARVLRPGGVMVHTTCLINPIHQAPLDFWRFTPGALRMLAEAAGLEVTVARGWGNQEAWDLVDLGFRGAKIPEDPENPLFKLATRNDPKRPIVTWVVARKPAAAA